MYSIGQLSTRTSVKIPTIRYYEQIGLLDAAGRTSGNQRRYTKDGLDRLVFIRHARELGFSIESISALIELQEQPDRTCQAATLVTTTQLQMVQEKISLLKRLETELVRLADRCEGDGTSNECYIMKSLADHKLCLDDH